MFKKLFNRNQREETPPAPNGWFRGVFMLDTASRTRGGKRIVRTIKSNNSVIRLEFAETWVDGKRNVYFVEGWLNNDKHFSKASELIDLARLCEYAVYAVEDTSEF